ncbi:hypothetical protein GCM10017688_02890 [Streptomyces ramulosus]
MGRPREARDGAVAGRSGAFLDVLGRRRAARAGRLPGRPGNRPDAPELCGRADGRASVRERAPGTAEECAWNGRGRTWGTRGPSLE